MPETPAIEKTRTFRFINLDRFYAVGAYAAHDHGDETDASIEARDRTLSALAGTWAARWSVLSLRGLRAEDPIGEIEAVTLTIEQARDVEAVLNRSLRGKSLNVQRSLRAVKGPLAAFVRGEPAPPAPDAPVPPAPGPAN